MQIVPIRDLRNTTAISEACNNSREPIFITKNGYGDMVLMNMEVYEQLTASAELYRKLMIAEHEYANGKMLDGRTALANLRARYE